MCLASATQQEHGSASCATTLRKQLPSGWLLREQYWPFCPESTLQFNPDDPIELSKVQSVKVVARKRRDRSLPRAFEIFTDNKTYVFKAKDEKNAEEWLQCINVAVAQAKERENREVTTYL